MKPTDYTSKEYDLSIDYWRQQASELIFNFFVIIGFLILIPSLFQAKLSNNISLCLVEIIAYVLCIAVIHLKKIEFIIRLVITSVISYIVGTFALILLGPYSGADIWLFFITTVISLLYGTKGRFIAFAFYCVLHIIILVLIELNILSWQMHDEVTTITWLAHSMLYITLNLIFILISSILIKGFESVLIRTAETRDASIIGLAKLAEYRDLETGKHLDRLRRYSTILATELMNNSIYSNYINELYISDLSISSMLHDIGKVGVLDSILLKSSGLSIEEFEEIKKHPTVGYNVLKEIEKNIGGRSLYTMGSDIALYHHEKWDGSGYPTGKEGHYIPLSARIVALVDVYDALTSKRSYKDKYSHNRAMKMIISGKGSHFDPHIVDAFLRVSSKFEHI